MKYKLGFIGGGNMAEAIICACLEADILKSNQIIVSDPSEKRRQVLAKLGIATAPENSEVAINSEQMLIAIKPQQLDSAAKDIAKLNSDKQIIISIMAGITTSKLIEAIGKPARIVRVMPNTPVMIGKGMAGIALGGAAKQGDDSLAMQLFSSAGKAIRVEEQKLDGITAVSGSGPAYLFYLAQAIQQAATELGLGEESALLANQTILGAAQLLNDSPDSALKLCEKVKSPGGTTEAALNSLDSNKVSKLFVEAIKEAEKRSRELGA